MYVNFRCCIFGCVLFFFFFKQKTSYEMSISAWSSDVCSSDLSELVVVDIEMNGLAWLFQVPRSRCHLGEGGANRDPGVSLLHNLVRAVPSERTNHAREKGMVIGYDASATPGRRDDRDTEGLGEEAQTIGRANV